MLSRVHTTEFGPCDNNIRLVAHWGRASTAVHLSFLVSEPIPFPQNCNFSRVSLSCAHLTSFLNISSADNLSYKFQGMGLLS